MTIPESDATCGVNRHHVAQRGNTRPRVAQRKAPHPSTIGHLDALVAKAPPGHGVVVSGVRARGKGLGRLYDQLVTPANVDDVATRVAALGDSWHVYVSTCLTSPEGWADVLADTDHPRARGGADHVGALTCLWADLDVAGPNHKATNLPPTLEAAATVLNTLPQPSMMVATGGGLHAYWRLARPLVIGVDVTRDEAKALARGWGQLVAQLGAAKGWHVDQVGDLARVLRLCGTYNPKTTPATPVTLAKVGAWPPGLVDARPWQPGPEYDPEELAGVVANRVEAKAKRAQRAAELVATLPTATTRRPAPTGEGLNVLDALEALPWSEVWPPGWTHVGDDHVKGAPAELWLRPDSDSAYSAKCLPGVAVVWSDNVPGLPGGGQGYSRAQVMAWRLYGSPDQCSRLAKAMAHRRREAKRKGVAA